MVTLNERKLIIFMVKVKLWSIYIDLFKLPCINPIKGTRWLYDFLLNRQIVDNLKHAPCCPANHFHRQRLVFSQCTCGSNIEMRS